MTKTLLGWGLVLAIGAVGCGNEPPSPGSTGVGGDTQIIGNPLCSDPTGMGRPIPGTAIGGGAFGFSQFPPTFAPTTTQATPPPAISGGTLRVLADGHTAVAADPDRDMVYIVDLALAGSTTANAVRAKVALDAGSEPGRVVADAANRAHVALRRGGKLVTIDTATGTILAQRSVCAAPRGVAYDSGTDLVHVACSDGQLISLPAAGGDAVRSVMLDRDLRDVVVDGPRLRVSRFRSAEILTVEADGSVSDHKLPPGFRAQAARGGQLYTASVAYKMEEMPDGTGVMVLHQRGIVDQVQPVVGGYGGPDVCGGIVHPAVTSVSANGTVKSGPALAGMVLAVDMAVSHDSKRVAIVSAGNSTNKVPGDTAPDLTQVFVTTVDGSTDDSVGCMPDGTHGPCPGTFGAGMPILKNDDPNAGTGSGGSSGTAGASGTGSSMTGTGGGVGTPGVPPGQTCGTPDPDVPHVVAMEPVAVAFDGADNIIVQSREPAMLVLKGGVTITLSTLSRLDTGHQVFHANAGGNLACASCHAEGNDDGRTWNFTCQGNRRTQSLQTGLKGTEPFHWSGDETNFDKLMNDVFVGRMSGPTLATDQSNALFNWIDAQPRPLHTSPADVAAVARGKALFNDPAQAACGSCHAGDKMTNAQTVDVGTGGKFQVPSLIGIASRGPFMHNGCAKTLGDRFTNEACGGGDRHGFTSTLNAGQISDLVAYLNSI